MEDGAAGAGQEKGKFLTLPRDGDAGPILPQYCIPTAGTCSCTFSGVRAHATERRPIGLDPSNRPALVRPGASFWLPRCGSDRIVVGPKFHPD
ncbi:hypothetical protein BRADI_2g24203v3 [Brachypodium distachyon]|uniref:Uncharacterized protein n=1 Tax=Brachypodium distachyon TaxID=15368 RepID=A0A2K2DA74_BRADI|nr:hypothetical protein BRADI_2g24203v3 [Brachypodium distachyon]